VLCLPNLKSPRSMRYRLWAGYSLPVSLCAAAVAQPEQTHHDPNELPKELLHSPHSKHPLGQQNNPRWFAPP